MFRMYSNIMPLTFEGVQDAVVVVDDVVARFYIALEQTRCAHM